MAKDKEDVKKKAKEGNSAGASSKKKVEDAKAGHGKEVKTSEKKAEEPVQQEKTASPKAESLPSPTQQSDKDNSENKAVEAEKGKGKENGIAAADKVDGENKTDAKTTHDVRITYFNGTGRAELSRLILAAAGIEFDDNRIDSQQWAELKPGTPFSQVPILEYHGLVLGQSLAIARFLAKRTDMYGKDDVEQAKADAIVDYATDYHGKWLNVFRAETFEERASLIDNIFYNFLPLFFRNLESLLQKEGGQYFVGGQLTFADLSIFQILHAFTDPEDPFFVTLPYVEERFTILESFPLLKEHRDRILAIPGVTAWIEGRPRGLF